MPDQPAGFGRHPFLAPSTAIRPTPVRAYLGAIPFGVFETGVDSIPPLGPLDSKESHGDQKSKKAQWATSTMSASADSGLCRGQVEEAVLKPGLTPYHICLH